MNPIIKFLRNLFGFYAILIFIVVLIVAAICHTLVFTFVNEKRAPFFAHKWVSRPWARTLFIFYGIRLKTYDQKILDPNQTYVFIANHRSLLDIPAFALAHHHTFRFLAKAELLKLPLFGYLIKKLYITVDRKDKTARAKSMENMIKSIREGISVFIYPEGTRNKTDNPLLPFHDGAFRLAIQTQLPIAILVIKNADHLLSPKYPFALRPGKIICQWCETIPTTGLTQADLPMLKEKAAKMMEERL